MSRHFSPFDFFGTGSVKLAPENWELGLEEGRPTEETSAFLFRIESDPMEWMVLLYPSGLDDALYAELGNIFASREADRLSQENPGDLVLVSPPRQVPRATLTSLLRLPAERQQIEHQALSGTVHLELRWIRAESLPGGLNA